jgi:hypothetical protein
MHKWAITATQDEASWLDDHIAAVISAQPLPLPAHSRHIGSVETYWEQMAPNRAFVTSNPETGTLDDRLLAEAVVYAQLQPFGFKRAVVLSDTHHADWNDVQAKAQRLVQTGAVTITRNGYNSVSAVVRGDGTDNKDGQGNPQVDTHNVELKRDDPNSRAFTNAFCDCAFGQFMNTPRTRQWKRLQNRACWLANSQLVLADGTYCAIQDAYVGMEVLTTDGISSITHVWVNEYKGLMRSFRRVGSPIWSTLTEDHQMLINSAPRFLDEKDSGERSRKTQRVLRQSENWQSCPATDVQIGDWVKVAYTTAIEESQSLDVITLSPYFHHDGERVYRSVYKRDDPKVIKRERDAIPSSVDLDAEGLGKFYERIRVDPVTGCREWQGTIDISKNQLQFQYKNKRYNVRKVVWSVERGDRPEGSRIIPQCGNHLCVHPEHMSVRSKTTAFGKRCIATLPDQLALDENLLTIAGYYLAEGSFANNDTLVEWTFNIHETGYVDRLERALQALDAGELKRYPNADKGKLCVKVSNAVLVEVLRYLCGEYSRHKRLTPELMQMPSTQQRFFLERYAEGDGHIHPNGSFVISTVSDALAPQLVQMGARVYDCVPSWVRIKNRGGPTNRNKELTINHIRMDQTFNTGVVRLDDGYYAARITGIKESEHQGQVYNVTVPPTHTVAVDDIVSFQCSHILATQWIASSMPLDEERTPPAGQGQLFDQSGGQASPDMGLMQRSPWVDPNSWWLNPNERWDQQGISEGGGMPSPGGMGGPPPGGIPGQAPPPEDVLPQFQQQQPPPDLPPINPASTPGGRPGPTPTNPLQYPNGTFSHVLHSEPMLGQSKISDVKPAKIAAIKAKYADQLSQPGHQLWFRPGRRPPIPGLGLVHDPSGMVHTWPEGEATHADMMATKGLRDEDCSRFYIQPNGVVNQILGQPRTFATIMGADPALARANGMTTSHTAQQQYQNGDLVRLRQETMGNYQGRPESGMAGQSVTIPAGSVGEVLGTDPSTQLVNILFMGKQFDQMSYYEPYGATCWCFNSEVTPSSNRVPGPAVRRT